MPRKTLQQKLAKQMLKAENCQTREEALKILKKAKKIRRKMNDESPGQGC